MPISDEVIELAPVKKTKKTLIIMIAGMGALLALAVAFLVMYLLKPSVTEDTNHIKDVSVNAAELFTADGDDTLYASIGNEYTVYATITVDNTTSTNVKWEYDPTLLEKRDEKNDEGAYFKFIPRVGQHGKTAKITACSGVNSSILKVIEFKIVNQGAEDIQIKSWGVTGSQTQVSGDNLNKEFAITVPYYTLKDSSNNKPIRVYFDQLGKKNTAANTYSKLTCVDLGDNKKSNDVIVKTKNESTNDYVRINSVSVEDGFFAFSALKDTGDEYVEILLQANVNNDAVDTITKTIKVKVESNTTRGYVDSFYVFNKPVVDAQFMGRMLANGNTTLVDSSKIKTELGKDKSLKVLSDGDRQMVNSSNFEIVLPYSNTNSVTYDDIFKHVMINPANAQYSGGELVEKWYKDLKVTSSDSNVLQVPTTTDGSVKLYPKNVGKVTLTIRDGKTGSAGAKVEIPVRIIAQTTDVKLSVSGNGVTGETDNNKPDIEVNAGVGGSYDVTITYTFIAPDRTKAETLLEESCLNNLYTLEFNKDEMDVKLKGDSKLLESGVTNSASYTFTKSGSGASTTYKGTFILEVKVKKDTTGAAVLTFNKLGSDLFGDDVNSLKSKDKPFELSASFNITEKATSAKIIENTNEALKIVTYDGTRAGNFVRKSDTEAYLYVQNQPAGTLLDIVSLPEKLKLFVLPDKTYFSLSNIKLTNKSGLSYNRTENTLSFSGDSTVGSDTNAGTAAFDVLNVAGEKIATLSLQIYIIDAVTIMKPTASKQAYYNSTGGAITLAESDVKANYSFGGDKNFTYSDVDLYYGNNVKFGTDDKVKNGNVYAFKHNGTTLYEFDTNNRTLTAKTDIYAYSYNTGINFGNVQLDFLLKADDEYLGKHTGATFTNPATSRMKLEFIRRADGVAFFTNSDCNSHAILADNDGKFTVSVNQDTDAELYASTIININGEPVYVESIAEPNGHIAPVEKATFSMPSRITAITSEGPQASRYYFVTYHAPVISEQSEPISGATVYYNINTTTSLTFIVNNLVRPIKSIGIYSDKACNTASNSLLFGGFINEANKYTNTIYVKVTYDTKQDSFTTFESAELNLPAYLEMVGSETVLVPSKGVQEVDQEVFTCVIRLKKDEAVTDNKTIEIVPSNHKTGDKKVTCAVNVDAGLSELIVKNGEDTVATITAGNTGTYTYPFALKNKDDIKSLLLTFEYGATNSEGYSLDYNHTGSGLKVTYTSLNGLSLENNIKAAVSNLILKIDSANIATFKNQKITLTFTDEYNQADDDNVFALEIYITVTMDIYELAFADGTNAAVTVTGGATGNQTFDVTVKYNEGINAVQPENETITGKRVLDVYTYNGSTYDKYTGGITVTQKADGKTYTVSVANDIDREQTYYLMLAYDNVTFAAEKHVRAITVNTLTSHLEFKDDNSIKPAEQGDGTLAASILVNSATEEFTLVAKAVNDGSGADAIGKTVTYGLYSDIGCTTAMPGMTINNGVITVTDPSLITGVVYYRALYTESYTDEDIELKVAITYTIAPSAVSISGLDANMISGNIITLYYGNAGYTQANLSGKILVSTAFANAASIPLADATVTIGLQQTADSAYLDVTGNVLKPKLLKADVPVVINATYAGVTVSHTYHINIKQIAGLSFTPNSGKLNLLNKNDTLTVTPTIASDGGFNHTYTLSATNGLFTITGEDVKTIGFAPNTTAKKGAYALSATLSYNYSGEANSGITQVGTFTSSAEFTVNVVGDYDLTFNLTKDGNTIAQYANTEATKAVIDNDSTYGITVTSSDSNFVATYSAVATQVVSVAAFSGKTAAVTLIENASGAFSITVTATVGTQTYTCTQNYCFVYGDNVSSKLYMSANNGAYAEFNATSQSIDYTTTPYKFKYEITGLPTEADVSLVVNGVETKPELQNGATGTKYIEITATKPTTLQIGGSVQIGNRTVYLAEKTVELTATAPTFTLNLGDGEDEILPTETATFSIGKDTGFQGAYTVAFAVNSTACATINATTGVLTAKTDVLADHTVTVTATITVSNGAYAGTYKVDKSIVIKGVALPTIAWNNTAKNELSFVDGKDNFNYSADCYTFDDNGTYDYDGKVNITVSASSTSLVQGTDYTINAGQLTLRDTSNTKAGGSITLTVTAAITSGAHTGESVSDTLTVRVLPTMSTTRNSITIGNAKATYDLNGTAYKNAFAPNGISSEGDYSVVSIAVDNTEAFGTDGAKLIVKNNLTAATTVNITVTVLITNDTFKGVKVTGEKTVNINMPAPEAKNVEWNGNKYNDLTLEKADVLGPAINGTVQSINVVIPADVDDYVTVANNGTSSTVVSVNKNYGVYFADPAPEKKFTVEYIVTLTNGRVYYSTAEYTVAAQKVNITAKIGTEDVNGLVSVNSNETFIMQLAADKGFDVVITNVTGSTHYEATYGGNGLQLSTKAVNSEQNITVELTLNVAGQTTTYTFSLKIAAPITSAQYTATNTDNIDFAVNNGELNDQDNAVVSLWTAVNNTEYKRGMSVEITAPDGHNLSEYFDSLSIKDLSNNRTRTPQDGLDANKVTINFNDSWADSHETPRFELHMNVKTNAAIPLSIITVKYTTGKNVINAIPITVLYRVQVIGDVDVTLNTNAGGDTVDGASSYTAPLYKHSYNLPTLTRTGYTFDGWFDAENGGNPVARNATVTTTQPHTLYAHWTAKTYAVNYNANYSDAPAIEDTKSVTYGQTYGALTTPEREGYDFIGWTAGSAADSQVVTANTLVKPTDDSVSTITLYAQWRIQYCTVEINEGYTGGSVFTFQVPYGQSFTIHNSFRPTREGYRFDGWDVSGDVTSVTSDVIITARWIQLFTVSFDANAEGVDDPASIQIADGEGCYLPTVTRDGYEFSGWYNGDVEVENGASLHLTDDITLTAHWTKNVFIVTLDAGEGKVIGDNNTYTTNVGKNQSYDLHLMIVPTRDGYTFDGWYNSEDEEQTAAITVTADVTLTAHWTAINTYTVTFDVNGGDALAEGEETITVTYGGTYGDLPTPTRRNHVFDGWYTERDGGTRISDSTLVNIAGNHTLYAQWSEESE